MGATVADIITAVRELSGTEKTKQVTNSTLGRWINKGIEDLYDRILDADESYYSVSAPLTFGSGSDAATATADLPPDFYHMRGVKQHPGTPRERPIFPVTEADSNRVPGYILRGTKIQITPYRLAGTGPFEVRYAPKPPQFGRVLDLNEAAEDGIVLGPDSETALQVQRGKFTNADLGRRLYLYDCENSVNNLGPQYDNDGGIVLLSRPGSSSTMIDLNDAVEAITVETFTFDTVAMINRATQTGAVSVDAVELDEFLTNYVHYIECYVAAKVLEKKKQPTDDMVRQMAAEIMRVTNSVPDREDVPEAAPVLWHPRYGRGGCDGY